ncbi:MAG: 23S rRNA (adenine(2030)-N(6))-methyltransferase RlmJ [Rhizobiales bacterium]|nr:23S rRNA (adenine(2030)-N(6))-methyltransferase RlmJ [Hyphomicrobiales bacterium]MBO6698387.1 23S rRNA (adenine(2030)-N(6))-methyltransferase RlmJ [Hyphomicrobiales bacterium]MBO6735359.1 23S rRNA (adenine(2030)-N(6))-methyltransferase RlmJ [Hyphomicrobiales bacterium]MBO6910833.1 23S rRNA (adenine(2030)-N(6))-methyltransferase RlmJ [Hyphomicrobiales bacterium]
MLSYQHAYHAGNRADVHKHALLSLVLAYMGKKTKPLTYMETHAGRGLYDLGSKEAQKTGEATSGVSELLTRFPADHPYRRVIEAVRAEHGEAAYPGSPMLAERMLTSNVERSGDRLQLAELHPQEHAALVETMPRSGVHIYKEDGFPWAARRCPPTPRRGIIMIDPSYELAHDFTGVPSFLEGLHDLWPVGVIMLWYPILPSGEHSTVMAEIDELGFADTLRHEVNFAAASEGHRLQGSGMFVINPPYTLEGEAAQLSALLES